METTAWIQGTSVTGVGWSAVGAASLLEAIELAENTKYASHAFQVTDPLTVLAFDLAGAGLKSRDTILGIEVEVYATSGVPQIVTGNTTGVQLTFDGSTPVGDEKEFNSDGPGWQDDILGGASDLWGLTPTADDLLASTFGVLIAEGSNTTGDSNGRRIDFVQLRVHYEPASNGGGSFSYQTTRIFQEMDQASAAKRGYKVLPFDDNAPEPLRGTPADEDLVSVAASAQIFANAPAGTRLIFLTLRTAGVTMRFDGGTATAGDNGHDFNADVGQPYVFYMDRENALLVRAIENGGTCTGRVTYFGTVG